MLKKTALYEKHVAAGARIVEFGGWEMPVQYSGIRPEHLNVRNAAGLFDISHMGQLLVHGPDAEAFLNRALTNNLTRLENHTGQYTILCHDANGGGTVDDLYAFRLSADSFLLILNASRFSEDLDFLSGLLTAGAEGQSLQVTMENLSEINSALALQGPRAADILTAFLESFPPANPTPAFTSVSALQKNDLISLELSQFPIDGTEVRISRTGYTGEDGFEIMASHEAINEIWDRLLGLPDDYGLIPVGLGARDTLRLEAGYPLYGHELDMQTLPVEAGLKWAIDLDKPSFSGRQSIVDRLADSSRKVLVGLEIVEKAPPPRQGYTVFESSDAPESCGIITSGTLSPSLQKGIALAYVPKSLAQSGRNWFVDIRGKKYKAVQVRKSFLPKAG